MSLTTDTIILGINAYHGDSSACILVNGELIAAIEEERLRRIKHWAGFPSKAIEYCISESGVNPAKINHISYSRDPMANLHKKAMSALMQVPNLDFIKGRLANISKFRKGSPSISSALGVDIDHTKPRDHYVEHHKSHSASAFLVSPFEEAAVVSIDAFGDFRSTLLSHGKGSKIVPFSSVEYPHSLGLLYTALTQYLGFPYYGDEYKVMGLASYGQPVHIDELRNMITPIPNGKFKLNLKYFLHTTKGVATTWNDCSPTVGRIYSEYMEQRLGPARRDNQEITQRHKDLAASLQAVTEEIYLHVLREAQQVTKQKNLALAGGVAFNSVANGKILSNTDFEHIYIQSAAGDAGTALGSASYVQNSILNNKRRFVMSSSYWGPSYSDKEIEDALIQNEIAFRKFSDSDLFHTVATAISEGKIIGWFQGRVEWGPRALGNRSILVDPRRPDMPSILNDRIKRRENFRPFAPSILLENTSDYFEQSYPDPFMLKVYKIKEEKRPLIPAVTHVDGTGRLQTVSKDDNHRYWSLIKAFSEITGIPVLLNTSFNENEPIVCTPNEAIACFQRAHMDMLVAGNYVAELEANL